MKSAISVIMSRVNSNEGPTSEAAYVASRDADSRTAVLRSYSLIESNEYGAQKVPSWCLRSTNLSKWLGEYSCTKGANFYFMKQAKVSIEQF